MHAPTDRLHDRLPERWACLTLARRHDPTRRVPLWADGVEVGSVAREHLDALAGERDLLRLDATGLHLRLPRAERDAALAGLNARLHRDGLIRGWRGETYAIRARPEHTPVALIERAAARFWGTLTLGAHATGYVTDTDDDHGRPTHLWIARRSYQKSVDPGRLDNLVGGGVPWPQTPFEALVREGWEEAGQAEATMRRAVPGRVMVLRADIAEGLQREWLYSHDLRLPADVTPVNQDGEVHAFHRLPVAEALDHAARGEMTVDAALVTLDFALRHRLLPADEAAELARAVSAIEAPPG
jgi:8-oxo-dGTP pyrophosphatase MutT (NUDIX family)